MVEENNFENSMKDNLKNAWATNSSFRISAIAVFVIFMLAIIIAIANVRKVKQANVSKLSVVAEGLKDDPFSDRSEAYEEALRQDEEQRLQEATATGDSVLPYVGTFDQRDISKIEEIGTQKKFLSLKDLENMGFDSEEEKIEPIAIKKIVKTKSPCGQKKTKLSDDDIYNRNGINKAGYDENGYLRDCLTERDFGPDGYAVDGYDKWGYDRSGYDIDGYDKEGYNKDGYNKDGYNRNGINREGLTRNGTYRDGLTEADFGPDGYAADGYDKWGYDRDGYDKNGLDKNGYDKEGYNKEGYNRNGIDREGLTRNGTYRDGLTEADFGPDGYAADGYDKWGYDKEGYDKNGLDKFGRAKNGYGSDGYDKEGYDKNGYDKDGYDKEGYNRNGINREGLNKDGVYRDGLTEADFGPDGYAADGYDKWGYDRNGYSKAGLDKWGYDKDGYGVDGYNREGYNREGYNSYGFKDPNFKGKSSKDESTEYSEINKAKLENVLLTPDQTENMKRVMGNMGNQIGNLVTGTEPVYNEIIITDPMLELEGLKQNASSYVNTGLYSQDVILDEEGLLEDIANKELILSAGNISYAVTLIESNSDVPGPVLAKILTGPLKGFKVIGKFTMADKYLVIEFNKAVLGYEEYEISGFALDPTTTLPGLASDIDHHYLNRFILPVAADFVSSLGDAISDRGTEVNISDGVVSETTRDLDTSEEFWKASSEAGKTLSEMIRGNIRTGPTVKLFAGEEIGILFIESVYGENDINE